MPGHRLRRIAAGVAAIAFLGLLFACAPKQVVPLHVDPERFTVFVDGDPREETPAELELRADRNHKLYFKSPGHRPELVVLRSNDDGGGVRLEPDVIEVRLQPIQASGRSIVIEEEAPAAGATE